LAIYKDRWRVGNRWDPKRVTKNKNPRPEGGSEGWYVGNIEKGKWTDWVFHIKWSHKPDGLLEVWKDGKLVVRKTGPNTYNDEKGPFLKMGFTNHTGSLNQNDLKPLSESFTLTKYVGMLVQVIKL